MATRRTSQYLDRANCIRTMTAGVPPTLVNLADLTSNYADGWTLNWTTGSALQELMFYLVLGDRISVRIGGGVIAGGQIG